ncbi:VOC family protein [Pedococcus sp. 5OH_020]|jgi:catechol 2,3-dioxygenase-like lactoylglutathione lyase family enzyme|uniref:VOC family protein n=1 Tax=Pedococcus sp. 5OH_020 TaxID=2989814 RepID=UPI0022E9E666|nr:VOC family protein [Pedococcus sp. 5OH_020]
MSLASSAVSTLLPVTDTGRAKEFYSDRLGLPFQGTNGEGSLMYELSGGTTLMLLPREAGTQNPSTALTWEVADLRSEISELEGRGVVFEDYDVPGLKTVDHIAEMDGERAAWFLDPDRNVLCIHEMAASG